MLRSCRKSARQIPGRPTEKNSGRTPCPSRACSRNPARRLRVTPAPTRRAQLGDGSLFLISKSKRVIEQRAFAGFRLLAAGQRRGDERDDPADAYVISLTRSARGWLLRCTLIAAQ